MESQKQCPFCKSPISEENYFCPNCGKQIKIKAEEVSIGKQIVIYFISFFLAPFGLGYALKYLKQPEKKAKIIGLISLLLTIIAIILVIVITKSYFESAYKELNEISNSPF